MHFDWAHRAAIERRMAGREFLASSRLLANALVTGSLEALADAVRAERASADDLLFAVRCHGVAARLHALAARQPGLLPSAATAALWEEAARIAQRSARLAALTLDLSRAAETAGVPFVPLKGTCLRLTRPQEAPWRSSADIDLLIEDRDLEAWAGILGRIGYSDRQRDRRHVRFARPDEVPQPTDGDHRDHPCPIELHTALRETILGRRIDITAAYRRGLSECRVAGLPVLVPGAPALSLHLVAHAAPAMLDRGLRLAQLLDLALVGDDRETIAVLREGLGPGAWIVDALCERDLPGLLPARLRGAFDAVAPGPLRRALVRRRPGLLRGDPTRVGTLAGELLLSGSPRVVFERVAEAIAVRGGASASVDAAASPARAVRAYLRALVSRDGS